MLTITPEVLILSNRYDFSCDYIAAELADRGIQYLRLNVDDFPGMELFLDPTEPRLSGTATGFTFSIEPEVLRSIYFRCPAFLRESPGRTLSASEQMSRSQWAAFTRSFMVFEDALWINHPQATYRAEVKPVQLRKAHSLGFNIPETIVSNSGRFVDRLHTPNDLVVLKSIDTLFVHQGDMDAFAYSVHLPSATLALEDLSAAPAILQGYIDPKVDLRVTVIGESVFAVKILKGSTGIAGDWRLHKDHVQFIPCDLPRSIKDACIHITKELGLVFGAVDLVESGGEFFFIEINPTGEWAWLVEQCQLPIDKAIATCLCKGRS